MNDMDKVKVKIRYTGKHKLPSYQTKDGESDRNSGMDIYANLESPCIIIPPLERALIPTGIFVKLPEGYGFSIRSRSGLAAKEGIIVLNEPATIDESFVNKEIKVILFNTSNKNVYINDGDRIAQLVLEEIPKCEWDTNWIPTKEDEDRDGGFGHSGKR